MSKYKYLFDYGHGGMINNTYQTKGKQSPKFDDGTILYEGVNNRDNVKRFMAALALEKISCTDIVSSEQDISLQVRAARANGIAKKEKCIYLSIHSDAAPGGDKNWVEAKGITVYTSPGQTQSDLFAEILVKHLELNMSQFTTIRKDKTDGDGDKEAKFYVLTATSCPSVLIEGGFHTHKEEAKLMLSEPWKAAYTKSITDAVKEWEASTH